MMWSNGDLLKAGKYRIIRQIGGGGFGLTYLAEDCFLQRQVVIKAPNQIFQTDQNYEKFTKRFQREAQALVKISHPNIVQFIELFKEAGIPYLVMAYVDGETLNQRIRHQGRLSEEEATKYFRALAIALHTVHKAGLIHCDIHPGNIMLQRLSNEPVLIDFGSVKFLQPNTVTITTTHNDNFTPYEQRRNGNEKRKPTLDVYGLAATLYFAVTGEKPEAAINRKIYGDTLKPPQKHCPELSEWLNIAILKGMALEAEDRPQSMQEWLGLLHPAQPTQRQAKSSQFDPSTFLFILLGSVLLVCLSIGTLLGLSNTMALAGTVAVAVGWTGAAVLAWSVTALLAGAGTRARIIARTEADMITVVAVALGARAIKSLEKRYNPRSFFLILGTTSTLGLILGVVLGWFLKLQGVSLPF